MLLAIPDLKELALKNKYEDIIIDHNYKGDLEIVSYDGDVRTKNGYSTANFMFGSPTIGFVNHPDYVTRMTFDKSKGAFRAGYANHSQWNGGNLGQNSMASGVNAIASGGNSFATGDSPTASGTNSISVGHRTVASGFNSNAFGNQTTSESYSETVVGTYNK